MNCVLGSLTCGACGGGGYIYAKKSNQQKSKKPLEPDEPLSSERVWTIVQYALRQYATYLDCNDGTDPSWDESSDGPPVKTEEIDKVIEELSGTLG